MSEPQQSLRLQLLLLLLLVQQGAVLIATVTCRLHMEGYGHTTGLKSAQLDCTGGMITAAAHPMLAPFKSSCSGVQWINSGACGVGRKDCLLTVCGKTEAVFEAATAVHVNVSTAAQSLVCVVGRSNVTFHRARFHANTARCISLPQQSSNATAWLNLSKCAFTNNSAPVDWGGVLYLAGGVTMVEASRFSGNYVRERGGAIGVTNTAQLTLIASLLHNNTGKRHGG